MNKVFLILLTLLASGVSVSAQKYFTRDAKIKFFSDAKVEKIEGVNKSGTAVYDTQTGKMAFKVLVKGFLFEKALMQEHFNENYMESDKYPSATFNCALLNPGDINLGKEGVYKARVKGEMEMHGVKKEVEVPGTITVGKGTISIKSEFIVKCSDFNIKIEAQKVSSIANEIKVTVDAALAPMK